jgi:ATP-binding cassette subfamily C protein/ATP-binding cassette subfamily C protein LapB
LFLVAVLCVGGWLVLVPLTAAAVYVAAAITLHGRFRSQLRSAAEAANDYQNLLVETATKLSSINRCGLSAVWIARHRNASARAATDSYALNRLANFTEIFADTVKLSAGALTLAFGLLAAMSHGLSVGALIASMALVWRTLSPFQVLFLAAIRLEQARRSIAAIDALMALETERQDGASQRSGKIFAGRITFNHVSYRFRADREPAVFGLNFEARPGELIALVGPSGAGKSTVLKLILGMYLPQLGGVHIDGLNIRQLDPVRLRQSIAYLPQVNHFFHGTVAQNLRLVQPTASDAELAAAAIEAQLLDEIMALPQGFDTWLDNERLRHLPEGQRQRLALARVYVRKSSILLLDQPGQGLDLESDEGFVEAIRRRKGQSTIFMVTHRPRHVRLADRVFLFDRGMLRASGPPEKILPMLTEHGR